jgi:hypothetical protein
VATGDSFRLFRAPFYDAAMAEPPRRSQNDLTHDVEVCIGEAMFGKMVSYTFAREDDADEAWTIVTDWLERWTATDVEVTRPAQGKTLNFRRGDPIERRAAMARRAPSAPIPGQSQANRDQSAGEGRMS